MDRRTVLKGLAGVGKPGGDGWPFDAALSQAPRRALLRFVPQANLANFDPGGAPSMSCATPPRWCGILCTASTLRCSRSADGRVRGGVR